MVLIVLSSGCISLGGFADSLSSDDDSVDFTEVNKTADGLYSVDNVSFKCPDNWTVGKYYTHNGNISIVALPIHENTNSTNTVTMGTVYKAESGKLIMLSADTKFKVDILSNNNNMSDQEAINYVRENMIINEKKISSSIVEVDGIKAFKNVVYIDTDKFSAEDKSFDSEKSNFDIILNSFKVD